MWKNSLSVEFWRLIISDVDELVQWLHIYKLTCIGKKRIFKGFFNLRFFCFYLKTKKFHFILVFLKKCIYKYFKQQKSWHFYN